MTPFDPQRWRATAKQLEEARRQTERELPKAKKRTDAAREELGRARRRLHEAEQELRQAATELDALARDSAAAALERQCRDAAPACLRAFVASLTERADLVTQHRHEMGGGFSAARHAVEAARAAAFAALLRPTSEAEARLTVGSLEDRLAAAGVPGATAGSRS